MLPIPRARRAAVVAASLAAACTAPPPAHVALAAADAEAGRWGERYLVEAHAIPAAWLVRDVDGAADDPDAEDAAGFALRAAAGNRDQSIGVLFQSFAADGDALDLQVLSLDTDVRTPLDPEGPGIFFARAGAGLGAAWLDLPADDPGGQLAAQLRLGIDVQPSAHLILGASFGGIVVGHPGETEAYGTFVTVGGALVF